jgi:hypothetical protein
MRKLVFTTIFAGSSTFAFIGLMAMSCGSPDNIGAGGNGGDGDGGKGGNGGVQVLIKFDGSTFNTGGAGGSSSSGPPPSGDANCGNETSSTKREPADVLLVLDRSGSMSYSIADDCCCDPQYSCPTDFCKDKSNCTVRWKGLTSAVQQTLSTTQEIHWGLKLYSSSGGSSCGVNPGVEVEISTTSASSIQTQIEKAVPGSSTPTAKAVNAALTYLKTVTDQSNKVILLATDGEPNCKGDVSKESDVDGTITAITAAKSAGFPVYVIGIGPSVGNLDNFAQAGGTGKFFPATSSEELVKALAAISKAVASCTFSLSTPPPDINNIAVYLDKNLIPKNDSNGWSLSGNSQTVLLNGTYCDKITSGEATTVQVLFGCPGYNPPIIIP